MNRQVSIPIIAAVLFLMVVSPNRRFAVSTPVDVNGDGIVGPEEVIDLSANWKGPALSQAGNQPWQTDNQGIHYDAGLVGIGGPPSGENRLLLLGGSSIGTAAIGSASKGPNFSHIHYGPLGDWYIRSAANEGRVILQDSGGYVGIGTPEPEFPLTISGFGYGWVHKSNETEVGSYINSLGGWLGTRSDHPLHFFTNDSLPQVTLTQNGHVGIGETNPIATLEVKSPATSSTGIQAEGYVNGVLGYGAYGVRGEARGQGATAGIVGDQAFGTHAGLFYGDVAVTGMLTKSSGGIKIDHPLDPANKYLTHSSIESSESMNLYSGNAATDASGYAEVRLPDWFEAFNRDFRYHLTVLDEGDHEEFVQAKVVKKVENNRFTIRTSRPNVEVSWQITCIRNDPSTKSRPMKVEQMKPEKERGKYLDPEAYKQPKEMGIYLQPEVKADSHSRKNPKSKGAETEK